MMECINVLVLCIIFLHVCITVDTNNLETTQFSNASNGLNVTEVVVNNSNHAHLDPIPIYNDSPNLSGISDNVAQLVSLCCFLFLGSCILQFIISKINDKIPISIVCFIFGMLTYVIYMSMEHLNLLDPLTMSIAGLRKIDSSILYYVALPILLYETTQDINWYAFCNFLLGGICLAVIGVVFQVILLGVLFHYALDLSSGGSIVISFLLASILSSTDPVAVLSVLNGVNAPFKLSSIFNGESLINDGSSVLLFQFVYLLMVGKTQPFWYYFLLFLKLLIMGPVLGIVFAVVVTIWISLYRKYHLSQCLAVITSGYCAYYTAEYALNLSGPLAIVCYGVFIKAYGLVAFDREALEKHRHFMGGLCLISNSAVFIISGALTVGMLKSQFVGTELWINVLKLAGAYLFLNLARAIMICLFTPLLSYIGYALNMKEICLLIWGGLRGAIVLVLGLRLESDDAIDNEISDLLGFYISGSVMIILILQGLTFEFLYRILNPYPMKPFRQVYLAKVMCMIDYNYIAEIKWLETHWLFKGTRVLKFANKMVPTMSSIRWNKTGNIEFDIPNVNDVLESISNQSLYESSIKSHSQDVIMPLDMRCHTVISCSSVSSFNGPEDIEQEPDDREYNTLDNFKMDLESCKRVDFDENELDSHAISKTLLTHGIESAPKGTTEAQEYNPKMYLRLLEHALTLEMPNATSDSLNCNEQISSTLLLQQQQPIDDQLNALEQRIKSRHINKQYINESNIRNDPTMRTTRTDTDATINLENLCIRPVHRRLQSFTTSLKMKSNDSLYQTPIDDDDDDVTDDLNLSNGPVRKVLRKEREGELYIMIFNAFSDMYNKLYHSDLIDGGSLLALQSSLDISADFALKKLKKRSITAWQNALRGHGNDGAEGDSMSHYLDKMDGFEFEWLVLKALIEGTNVNINYRVAKHFWNFSQHSRVLSLLELLVAFIDVHQHILDRGGRNLEKLLDAKLLNSYKEQIINAKRYINVIKAKYPNNFGYGLLNMAACMMIRTKRDIVNEQCSHGLLLDEDRKRILEMLDEQLYRVSTNRLCINFLKSLFKRNGSCTRGKAPELGILYES